MNSNKRLSIRVAVRWTVKIENDLGERIPAVVLDVSNRGIGLRCHTDDRNRITPQGAFVKQGRPVEVRVYLKFPGTQGSSDFINVRCGIVYSRRLAQDLCQIGMCFLGMEASTETRLNQFIQNAKLTHNRTEKYSL